MKNRTKTWDEPKGKPETERQKRKTGKGKPENETGNENPEMENRKRGIVSTEAKPEIQATRGYPGKPMAI